MSTLSHDQLRQFTGDLERYRHALTRRVIYTPGVRFLAEEGGAYWLVDEIALALGSSAFRRAIARDSRVAEMHFWRLDVSTNRSAKLTAQADCDEAPFIVRDIRSTDFPLDHVEVWAGFDGEHWTLYLPSEH